MAKTLEFTDTSAQTVKIGDTTTSFTMVLGEDSNPVDLTNATNIVAKLGNNTGYLKSQTITTDNIQDPSSGKVIIKFDSDFMNGLPAGYYLLEVWVTYDSGTAIYPSGDLTGFMINDNIESQSGSVIKTITYDDFVAAMNKAASTIAKGDKGDKGDPGPQGPKGVKANLEALKSAYPNGTDGIWITQDDGYWNFWDGTAWTKGNVYQGTAIADGSIGMLKLAGDTIPLKFVPSPLGLPTYDSKTYTLTFSGTSTSNAEYVKVNTSFIKIPPKTVVDCTPQNGSADGFLQINLSTGFVSYQSLSWKKPDANYAILAMLKHGVVKNGATIATLFSGTLADFVIIDGKPQQMLNQPLDSIEFIQSPGVRATYDPSSAVFNFGDSSNSQTKGRIYYSGMSQEVPANTTAAPTSSALNSYKSVKVVWNPATAVGEVVAWNETSPSGYFCIGAINCDGLGAITSFGLGDVVLVGAQPELSSKQTIYKREETTWNILHYGYHTNVPHESAASYFKSIEKGFDLDCDICWTKDNVPICSHSNSTTTGLLELIRNPDGTAVTETFDINNKTYDELCAYDWGIYCGDAFKGLKPLKFEDFLKIMHANDCYANVEWKTKVTDSQFKVIGDLLRKYDCLDRIVFESFYDRYYNLTLMQSYFPNATLAINATGNQALNTDFIEKLKGLSNNFNVVFASFGSDVDKTVLENVLLSGFKVEIWVVNNDDTLALFKDYAISGWFTDGDYDPKSRVQALIENEF